MSGVKSLTVTGYKSIRKLPELELKSLNVLIGANGAGKSNFIGLFRLLNEMVEQRLQIYVPTHGGPDELLHFGRKTTEKLHVQFRFSDSDYGYEFSLIPTIDNRLIFGQESSCWFGLLEPDPNSDGQWIKSSHKADLGRGHEESRLKFATDPYSPEVTQSLSNVTQSLSNWRIYHFHDIGEKARVKQRHPANDNLRLKMDAANLAAYLRMLNEKHRDHYLRIVDTIRLVAPFFGDFVHRPDTEYVELEWMQKGDPDTPFKAHRLSDGTLRFICLATLLLQPTELLPDTVLIDEPELGLHPYAISILADIFKQVSEQRQLIIATHSVELVNELSPEDIIVVDQENDASTFKRFTEEELAGWLKQYAMGELWKRNVLGGRP